MMQMDFRHTPIEAGQVTIALLRVPALKPRAIRGFFYAYRSH
jgi:hypothetical protein